MSWSETKCNILNVYICKECYEIAIWMSRKRKETEMNLYKYCQFMHTVNTNDNKTSAFIMIFKQWVCVCVCPKSVKEEKKHLSFRNIYLSHSKTLMQTTMDDQKKCPYKWSRKKKLTKEICEHSFGVNSSAI